MEQHPQEIKGKPSKRGAWGKRKADQLHTNLTHLIDVKSERAEAQRKARIERRSRKVG